MPIINTENITITNNIHVTVPASSRFMSTYILHEQNDWFEDEIKFIRHFVKPGMRVIDIGANYGVYTLTIAKIIGNSGKIWSFEPTEATASCLKQSISKNKFNNIKLIQYGLSDRIGNAKFFTSPNSELNTLSKDTLDTNQHETISLLTLDHCKSKYKWDEIDLIKLDAEGEENNILKKGRKALSTLSPLIMFELMHGKEVNLPLINRFKSMGYDSYRLIPYLNILIPFDHNEKYDSYLLNLFCCKKDKAKQLEDEKIIVKNWDPITTVDNEVAKRYIKQQPYGKILSNINNTSASDDYLFILNTYAMTLSDKIENSDKIAYLMSSFKRLLNMIDKGEHRVERLVTFSRIAFDTGERKLGVKILTELYSKYNSNINYELTEPFFPASNRYDSINPNSNINDWLFSSIIEQLIEKHAFSTYYSKNSTLPLFKQLNTLGYMNKDMEKRYKLASSCFS
ncbi:MAG: FkbM family methyltransferase [Gammaproteobacteria bacterium]|nr:FkbM family methyltransferase [Gammaproteobacteria bacterium]MCW8923056.1 FkbM family methyltransferase [Gammaproteobacteria bacterium]